MKIHKYWLQGPKKGSSEIFCEELPGFPDNINYNDNGIFWLAMPDLRVSALEALYEKPFLRKVIMRLPEFALQGATPTPHGIVVGINENGKVVHNFQDSTGHVYSVTSATEFDGYLFIGNLRMDKAVRFPIK